MECGVDEGHLSRQILQMTKPSLLILVDTWATRRFNSSKLEMIQREFTEEIASGCIRIERHMSVDALHAQRDHSLHLHNKIDFRDLVLLAVGK